jgi:hypothetical protein
MTQSDNFDTRSTPTEGYPILFFQGTAFSPADSSTYFFGFSMFAPYTAGASPQRVYCFRSGSVRVTTFLVQVLGTLGSAEEVTVSLRVNGVTDYLLGTITLSTAFNAFATYWDPGVIPIQADDFMEFKIDTPAWATNPVNVAFRAQLWVEP